ncbi:hypothetical protein RF11_10227 [Thelohanellus kitauei]|uniref:Uncharacterized protein n=1 Tax=Thelohanellus kitauei TaxID=669202 RepID=A0A0C2MRM0_THEKT|nr:hypothetical protein RF11_10227 [Thelohanellus kitauei]
MRDLIKEYVENEGVKIDVNIFRTIKSIVIQIQNPDKDNLEEDEIFESLYGMEGAVEEAVEDWNSENPDEMERTITTSRRSAKSRARQKEEEDDDEDCSVDYVLQKKGTTKGKHSEQNMDEYSGLDPFSGDLLDGDDDFGSAFDFMEDDGPSLRPKPSTRLSKRDNMGSNSSLFSEF